MNDGVIQGALLTAALTLRYFSVENIAAHANVEISDAGRFLVDHPEWFAIEVPANDREKGSMDGTVWRLHWDKVVEVESLLGSSSPIPPASPPVDDDSIGGRSAAVAEGMQTATPQPFDLLAMTRSLVEAATTWSIDTPDATKEERTAANRSGRKLLRTANLYMGRLEADIWMRQVRAHERINLEVVEIVGLGERLRAAQDASALRAAPSTTLVVPTPFEASMRAALLDWSLRFAIPNNEHSPLPVDADVETASRWLLGDLGLHSSPFAAAVRLVQLRAAIDAPAYAQVLAHAVHRCRQILSIPAASVVLPAISVLAAVGGAAELAPMILAALVAAEEDAVSRRPAAPTPIRTQLDFESRSLVCASLARLAPISVERGAHPDSAAAACLYLVSRGCTESEFALLAPGALYGVGSDAVGLLRRIIASFRTRRDGGSTPMFSQDGALSRTLAIALFQFEDPVLIGGELPRRLEHDDGKAFMEEITNSTHGAIALVDSDDGFLLRPGLSVRATVPGKEISLAVSQNSEAADTLSWMLTATGHSSARALEPDSFRERLNRRGSARTFGDGGIRNG